MLEQKIEELIKAIEGLTSVIKSDITVVPEKAAKVKPVEALKPVEKPEVVKPVETVDPPVSVSLDSILGVEAEPPVKQFKDYAEFTAALTQLQAEKSIDKARFVSVIQKEAALLKFKPNVQGDYSAEDQKLASDLFLACEAAFNA